MKKRFLSVTLALGLVLVTASAAFAAFGDISDPKVAQDAAALNALGIMQGVGEGQFAPAQQLTRAQFCKLAATALGCTDVTGYKNYTVFPDVPAKHWATGYINAVVKQPDIAKKQIIRGFADGTFGPDKPITYGEACTMLLRMLDYTVADIGPIWPADYVAKAGSLGITDGIRFDNANSVVRRGDAAVMLCNTLSCNLKGGGSLLDTLSGSTAIKDSILLATAATDPSLGFGQVRFYENGEMVLRTAAATLDSVLVGTRGTVVFDKNASARVKSFIPKNANMESHVVKSTTQDRLETDGGTFAIPRKTPVVIGGKVGSYSENWFDVIAGDKVNFYYDSSRQLQLIAVDSSYLAYTGFVYGVGNATLPQGYRLQHNGVDISASQLHKYDVVSLNTQNRTAVVSDKRLTGIYQSASPSFAQPEKVTVMGKEFFISEAMAPQFAKFSQGDRLTLLLDAYGTVQGVYGAGEVRGDMVGIYSSSADGKVSVTLLNGVTVTGAPDGTIGADLLGKFVTVENTEAGKLSLRGAEVGSKATGDWYLLKNTVGSTKVAPDVKIYEQVATSAPLHLIDLGDITTASVAATDIRSTIKDSSGTIICIVLDDVTGDGWIFGIASSKSTTRTESGLNGNEMTFEDHQLTLKCVEDGKALSKMYHTTAANRGLNAKPVGVPRGLDQYAGIVYVPIKEMQEVGTVNLADFDRSDGVRVSSGYYLLAEDTVAYVPKLEQFMSLREAKANYKTFTLYADDAAAKGGKVRVVYAQ